MLNMMQAALDLLRAHVLRWEQLAIALSWSKGPPCNGTLCCSGAGGLTLTDWGLASASLDHVFATIVAAVSAAEAQAEGGTLEDADNQGGHEAAAGAGTAGHQLGAVEQQ